MSTSSDAWLKVWLQGGPAGEWQYMTLIEPPQVIYVIPDPRRDGWIRVDAEWDEALAYRREPSVEQFDAERIYYPVSDAS